MSVMQTKHGPGLLNRAANLSFDGTARRNCETFMLNFLTSLKLLSRVREQSTGGKDNFCIYRCLSGCLRLDVLGR